MGGTASKVSSEVSSSSPVSLQHRKSNIDSVIMLRSHASIVRHLTRLSQGLIVSAGDDGIVAVWDTVNGVRKAMCQVSRSNGNNLTRVTSLARVPLDTETLIAVGTSDKYVRLYCYETLELRAVTSIPHKGSITCIQFVAVPDPGAAAVRMVTGGNDGVLQLWKIGARASLSHEGTVAREDDENLHALLAISTDRVVAGSDSKTVTVYNIVEKNIVKQLQGHREGVHCIISTSSSSFATGSLDGSIIIWAAIGLEKIHVLNWTDNYFDKERAYFTAVHKMIVIDERYLAVALGNGFAVFCIQNGRKMLSKPNAHSMPCQGLIPIHCGQKLVTCGADSMVAIWALDDAGSASSGFSGQGSALHRRSSLLGQEDLYGSLSLIQQTSPSTRNGGSPVLTGTNEPQSSPNSPTIPQRTGESSSGGKPPRGESEEDKKRKKSSRGSEASKSLFFTSSSSDRSMPTSQPILVPSCISKLPGHSDAVICLEGLSDFEFASAGHDGTVFLWRDGRLVSSRENRACLIALLRENAVAS
eukprot:comp20331_c0_seq1/m.40592 comp20331_c0_seq1/g.40592  ORF comp20331_c0_seq1/g.40592 comp20331_c0_seq1/m.40592 type:complete len:529 (+) comp20331_c0_seq1:59-1645(+)